MKTLPEAFVTRMKALLGEEYAAYEASFSEPAVKSFRVNTNKISLEDGSMVIWLDTRWNIGHPDNYEIREDGIYVVKTVYYGFGAGVQTELEEGQKLEYGDDGSMIITGFDRKMDDLIYFVGTVSDHMLTLQGGEEISLRDLCGRNAMVRFSLE